MKKLYSLLLIAIVSTWSYGQVLTDGFNYADNALLTDNGWTAHSGGTTEEITVGASNGLIYAGYNTTAGNAALLDNTGQDVNKSFAAPIISGDIYLSFLVNVAAASEGYFAHLGNGSFAARVFVKPSATTGKINFGLSNSSTASYAATPTDFDLNTTYLIIVKYNVSTNGATSLWVKASGVPATEVSAGTPEVTATGSGQASIAGVYLRQYNASQNIAVDEIKVYTTWFGATPCNLVLDTATTACTTTTLNIDNYSVTIPFTGGGTGSYTLTSNFGTISGASPSTSATGNIIISGITEGVDVTLTITGACSLTRLVTAPECKPVNTLPFSDSFPYAVGSSLNASQKWKVLFSGDNVTLAAGSLSYPGFTSSGNSVTFSGAGAESLTNFTPTTSGKIFTSFIMNVSDMANITVVDPNPFPTSYFAVLTDATSGYNARLFFNKVSETQYRLGIDNAASTTNFDTTLRNVNDVLFVVIGYDFTSNTLNTWINPNLATFNDTVTPTITTTPASPITTIGGFLIRQANSNDTPTIIMDEVRVATTTSGLLSVSQNAIAGLKVYPNPVSNGKLFIETAANAERTIAIYDLLGKNVLNTTTSNSEVNVAGLNGGIYIIKITEEGNTTSRKLIIR